MLEMRPRVKILTVKLLTVLHSVKVVQNFDKPLYLLILYRFEANKIVS